VSRSVKDIWIVEKDVLCPVAVVDIEIDDGDSPKAVRQSRVKGADSHVIKEAEAHGTAALGVMPWRPDRAEGIPEVSA
jgi:hypothetical protein